MRSLPAKILFIFIFAFLLEIICAFEHVSVFSLNSYAQADTIYFAQALRVSFPKGSWYCNNPYETGGLFEHPGFAKISLHIEAGLVQVWKMSMDSLIRSNLEPDHFDKAQKILYTKNGFSIIEKKPSAEEANNIYHSWINLYEVYKYNDGYYVKMTIQAPYDFKKTADSLLSEIMNSIYLHTPEELDRKEGLPLNALNIDQYVAKEESKAIEKMIRMFGQSYVTEEVKNKTHIDLMAKAEKKMRWHFTHKEYFAKHRVIAGGHLSMDSWLDSKFGYGTASEIEYCMECGDLLIDPWFDKGYELVVDSFMRHECRISKDEATKWVASKTFDISGKENYWAVVTSYKNPNSPASVFIFKFTKTGYKWSFFKTEFDERHTKDPYYAYQPNDIDILLSIASKKGMSEMVEVKNSTRNIYYIGNSAVPQTNYIRIELSDRDTLKYNVEYSDIMINEPYATSDVSDNGNEVIKDQFVIIDKQATPPTPGPHFYAPTVHYNSYTDKLYNPSMVIKDDLLMKRIEKVPGVYYEEKSLAGATYTEVNKDTAYAAAMNLLKKQIAPAKRLYKTGMVYGDVNDNGRTDCYTFSISNGKLLGIRMLETTDAGVTELKADAAVIKKISATPLYKKMVEISLRPVNEEGDFVRY